MAKSVIKLPNLMETSADDDDGHNSIHSSPSH
jgi:hypothetical protein